MRAINVNEIKRTGAERALGSIGAGASSIFSAYRALPTGFSRWKEWGDKLGSDDARVRDSLDELSSILSDRMGIDKRSVRAVLSGALDSATRESLEGMLGTVYVVVSGSLPTGDATFRGRMSAVHGLGQATVTVPSQNGCTYEYRYYLIATPLRVNEIRRGGPALGSVGAGKIRVNPAWDYLVGRRWPMHDDIPLTWPLLRVAIENELPLQPRRADWIVEWARELLHADPSELRAQSIRHTSMEFDVRANALRGNAREGRLSREEADGSVSECLASFDSNAGIARIEVSHWRGGRQLHDSWHVLRAPANENKND